MGNLLKANRKRGSGHGKWIEGLETRAYCAVDLSVVVSFTAPASHQVKPGHAFAITIEVFNNGDTKAVGKLATQLGVSLSPDGSSPIPAPTANKTLHLAPGAHVTFHLSAKVPLTFTPGTYYGVAHVDPNNTFAESDLTNNTSVSSDTLTVLSLYPNVVGTYVGSGVIKKGVDKGLTFTQSVTNTSENNTTGIISFVGTDVFSNGTTVSFAGQTTVKPNGTYVAIGADTPADASVSVKDVGKYTGNVSKGTFVTAINSGTYNDTLEG